MKNCVFFGSLYLHSKVVITNLRRKTVHFLEIKLRSKVDIANLTGKTVFLRDPHFRVNFKCQICTVNFVLIPDLSKHIVSAHEEEP